MTIPRKRDAHGSSLTFSGLEANIIEITPGGASRAAIAATHLGTQDAEDFVPAALVNAGEVSCTIELDPDADWTALIQGDEAQLVVTFPDGSTWTWATAFVKDFKPAALKTGDGMTASVSFQLNCLPTIA
jgi:hypothetical protein